MNSETTEIIAGIEKDLKLVDQDFYEYNLNYFRKSKSRYAHILGIVEKYAPKGKTLELGSFPFHLTLALKKVGFDVDAVDIAPDRAKAFIDAHELNVETRNFEAEGVGDHRTGYDLVLLLEVYEHLRLDPITTLIQIHKALNDDGMLIISVPNMYSIFNIINFLRGRGFDDPYHEFSKIHRLGHMGHVREYSSKDMLKILSKTGFDPVTTIFSSPEPLSRKHRLFGIGVLRKIFPSWNAIQTIVCKKKP